jgi:hypothetical protein
VSTSEQQMWDRYYMRRLADTQRVPELRDNPMLAFDIAHDDDLDDDAFDDLLEVFRGE